MKIGKRMNIVLSILCLIILTTNILNVKGAEHVEGNTTVRNAFEIPHFPFQLIFNIEDKNDERWFKVRLNQTQALKLKADENYGVFYDIYIEDELKKSNPSPFITRTQLPHSNYDYHKLEAGVYYIKVYSDAYSNKWKDKDIKLTFDTFNDDLYEPNDKYQEATPVLLGQPMTIRLSGTNDVDWFKVKLNKTTALKIKQDGNSNIYYQLYTEDELKKSNPIPLLRQNVDREYNYYKLETGTYYIEITPQSNSSSWKGKDITLTIDTFDDDIYEPNDTYQEAAEVQLGQPMSIRLSGSNDVDWFKVKLNKTTGLRLEADYGSYAIYTEDELQRTNPSPFIDKTLHHNDDYHELEAGTYYIKIYPHNSMGKDIILTFDTFDNDIYEPNDTYEEATPVLLGQPMTIRLSGSNDVDWFKIKLNKTTALKLKVDTAYYDIYTETELKENEPIPFISKKLGGDYDYHKLEAGTYYIKIYPYSNFWNGKNIAIIFDTFDDDKYEPNDTYQQATPVLLGQPMTIRLSGTNDVDWFKVKIDKVTALKIKQDGNSNICYQIYTADELKKSNPNSFINQNLGNEYHYYKLEAGTYYIKIYPNTSSNSWKGQDINLMVDQVIEDQFEYNDTLETSKVLLLNKEQFININAPEDVDWFKFSLDEAQKLRLSMTSAFSKNYKYAIYQANNTSQSINSGTINTRNGNVGVTFQAGDYYLRISGDSSNYSEEMVSLLLAKEGVDLNRVSVNSYAPRGSSQDVYQNIEITFSKPLLASSVTKEQFDIKWFNDSIDFDVEYIEGETKVTLVPKEPLSYASDYTVFVSKNLKAQDNELSMSDNFSWTFKTREKRPSDSRGGTVTGKVILPEELKELVVAAKVQVIKDGKVSKTVTPKTDGKFSITDLPVGTYDLRVKLAGFLSDAKTVTLNYGDDLIVNLNPIVGDLNGDGIIDLYDITTVSNQYNQQSK